MTISSRCAQCAAECIQILRNARATHLPGRGFGDGKGIASNRTYEQVCLSCAQGIWRGGIYAWLPSGSHGPLSGCAGGGLVRLSKELVFMCNACAAISSAARWQHQMRVLLGRAAHLHIGAAGNTHQSSMCARHCMYRLALSSSNWAWRGVFELAACGVWCNAPAGKVLDMLRSVGAASDGQHNGKKINRRR